MHDIVEGLEAPRCKSIERGAMLRGTGNGVNVSNGTRARPRGRCDAAYAGPLATAR